MHLLIVGSVEGQYITFGEVCCGGVLGHSFLACPSPLSHLLFKLNAVSMGLSCGSCLVLVVLLGVTLGDDEETAAATERDSSWVFLFGVGPELEEGPPAWGGALFFFLFRETWVYPVSELGVFSDSRAEWAGLVTSITAFVGSDVLVAGFFRGQTLARWLTCLQCQQGGHLLSYLG